VLARGNFLECGTGAVATFEDLIGLGQGRIGKFGEASSNVSASGNLVKDHPRIDLQHGKEDNGNGDRYDSRPPREDVRGSVHYRPKPLFNSYSEFEDRDGKRSRARLQSED